jgi:hypothetical protein
MVWLEIFEIYEFLLTFSEKISYFQNIYDIRSFVRLG